MQFFYGNGALSYHISHYLGRCFEGEKTGCKITDIVVKFTCSKNKRLRYVLELFASSHLKRNCKRQIIMSDRISRRKVGEQ
jgi:hypothetical protein